MPQPYQIFCLIKIVVSDTFNALNDTPPFSSYKIALLKISGYLKFSFFGIQEYFDYANDLLSETIFDVIPIEIDEENGSLVSHAVSHFDCLIIPPMKDGLKLPILPPNVKQWILKLNEQGTTISSACAGSFILAQTGILDQLEATTHWKLEEHFRKQFPLVNLNCDKILIQQGNIITAGGLSAWIDLCIFLTAKYSNNRTAREMSRIFLVDTGPREQKYYSSFHPPTLHGDTEVLKCQRWLESSLNEPLDYTKLVQKTGLGSRTLQRRFKAATGCSITQYIQNSRIQKARDLLEESNLPVESIVWEIGYEDTPSFGKLFKREVGLSPAAYRKRFRMRIYN